MRIYRESERGGTFQAPLAVAARMTFVPVKGKSSRKLELTGSFTFPASPIPWSLPGGTRVKQIGSLVVDTNGDLKPDTRLYGTSNFAPGWSPKLLTANYYGCTMCEPESCHADPSGKEHCTGPVYACGNYNCP